VVDIGGGWGAFAASCMAIGMRSLLIDDFSDLGNSDPTDPRQTLVMDYHICVHNREVLSQGLGLPPSSVDAVTTFDLIEHLHASPRKVLHEAVGALRPNGVLIIGTPNRVNLRKRLSYLIGQGEWSRFADWYHPEVFRGHVREPNIKDLQLIAADLDLKGYKIIGRNWSGYGNPRPIIRNTTRVMDTFLRLRPSLCSDLYVVGYKK
jgi:SAM-dependent methyltransferase